MKKTLFTLVALLSLTWASAYEIITETVKITGTDGKVTEFNVNAVSSIDFLTSSESVTLRVATPNAETFNSSTLSALFSKTDAGVNVACTDASSTTVEGLEQGHYRVDFNIPSALLSQAQKGLALPAEGVDVALGTYSPETHDRVAETKTVSSGKLTATVTDSNITFTLLCTFADGTDLIADFQGQATKVDDLSAPKEEYTNTVTYYNADGTVIRQGDISQVIVDQGSGMTMNRKVFTFKAFDMVTGDPQFVVNEARYGQRYAFTELPSAYPPEARFQWAAASYRSALSSANTMGYSTPINSYFEIHHDADGTYRIKIKVYMRYVSYNYGDDDYESSAKGDGSYVEILYKGK